MTIGSATGITGIWTVLALSNPPLGGQKFGPQIKNFRMVTGPIDFLRHLKCSEWGFLQENFVLLAREPTAYYYS